MTYIRWFEEVGAADVGLVGGKGANLGEMAVAGLPVPPGFCLTASAYRSVIGQPRQQELLRFLAAHLDEDKIQEFVESATIDLSPPQE